jgi:hypothetical protein
LKLNQILPSEERASSLGHVKWYFHETYSKILDGRAIIPKIFKKSVRSCRLQKVMSKPSRIDLSSSKEDNFTMLSL